VSELNFCGLAAIFFHSNLYFHRRRAFSSKRFYLFATAPFSGWRAQQCFIFLSRVFGAGTEVIAPPFLSF